MLRTHLHSSDSLELHFYKVKLGRSEGIHYFPLFCSKTKDVSCRLKGLIEEVLTSTCTNNLTFELK